MTVASSPWSCERMAMRLRLDEVDWTPGGDPAWTEGRSDRSAVVSRRSDGSRREWTSEHSPRGSVGYGGGDFAFGSGALFYAERSGTIWRREFQGEAERAIFPRFGAVASPTPSPDGRWVACVHSAEDIDSIALCDAQGTRWPVRLAHGADFYMQPAWSPDSRRLAWVEWDHPAMPWDGSRLRVFDLGPGLAPDQGSSRVLDGDSEHAVLQPCWSPDGRHLSWIATVGDEGCLRVLELVTGRVRDLLSSPALLPPAWIQGLRVHDWLPDGSGLRILSAEGGRGRILEVLLDGTTREIDPGPFRWFSQIRSAPTGDRFLVVASAPDLPDRVVLWEGGRWTVLASSLHDDLPQDTFPRTESIVWSGDDGNPVHGLLHRPAGTPPAGGWPLLVAVHGGPTSQRTYQFSAENVFFVSRGWAVLDVNYRGSTGYGEAYRKALDGRWGELDVSDCISGARHLARRDEFDADRIVIKGGSSGGLTVLNALAEAPDLFRAGISCFGVTDLLQLAATTHKFEARYLDRLVGPLPESIDLYRARSPLARAAQIRSRLALFQGECDKVVPPEQAQALSQALEAAGTPHSLRIYPQEGHGWRRSETILRHYEELESLLQGIGRDG